MVAIIHSSNIYWVSFICQVLGSGDTGLNKTNQNLWWQFQFSVIWLREKDRSKRDLYIYGFNIRIHFYQHNPENGLDGKYIRLLSRFLNFYIFKKPLGRNRFYNNMCYSIWEAQSCWLCFWHSYLNLKITCNLIKFSPWRVIGKQVIYLTFTWTLGGSLFWKTEGKRGRN